MHSSFGIFDNCRLSFLHWYEDLHWLMLRSRHWPWSISYLSPSCSSSGIGTDSPCLIRWLVTHAMLCGRGRLTEALGENNSVASEEWWWWFLGSLQIRNAEEKARWFDAFPAIYAVIYPSGLIVITQSWKPRLASESSQGSKLLVTSSRRQYPDCVDLDFKLIFISPQTGCNKIMMRSILLALCLLSCVQAFLPTNIQNRRRAMITMKANENGPNKERGKSFAPAAIHTPSQRYVACCTESLHQYCPPESSDLLMTCICALIRLALFICTIYLLQLLIVGRWYVLPCLVVLALYLFFHLSPQLKESRESRFLPSLSHLVLSIRYAHVPMYISVMHYAKIWT